MANSLRQFRTEQASRITAVRRSGHAFRMEATTHATDLLPLAGTVGGLSAFTASPSADILSLSVPMIRVHIKERRGPARHGERAPQVSAVASTGSPNALLGR